MAGELDFAEALRRRVRLLAGLEASRPRRRCATRIAPGAGRPHAGAHAQAARLRDGRGERRLHPGDRAIWSTSSASTTWRPTCWQLDDGVVTGELRGPDRRPGRQGGGAGALRRGGRRAAGRAPSPSATGPTTSTCWPRPGSASPSTPSRWCARPPTPRSACPTSTPSSSCSASRAARWSWRTGSERGARP